MSGGFIDMRGPRARFIPSLEAARDELGYVPLLSMRSAEPPFRVLGIAPDPNPMPALRLFRSHSEKPRSDK